MRGLIEAKSYLYEDYYKSRHIGKEQLLPFKLGHLLNRLHY